MDSEPGNSSGKSESEDLIDSSTIRKVIKTGTDVKAIATDAVTILQKAVDEFLGAFVSHAAESMIENSRKVLSYKDAAAAVEQVACLDFLEDVLPQKVTAGQLMQQALEQQQQQAATLPGAGSM